MVYIKEASIFPNRRIQRSRMMNIQCMKKPILLLEENMLEELLYKELIISLISIIPAKL